jgi:hypothetical protein
MVLSIRRLPMLEAIGVDTAANGTGVVLLRVPPSRRRPHRHQVSKEVFVRRADESARITMREIQELTIQAVVEATHVDAIVKDGREAFFSATLDWLSSNEAPRGGMHFIGVPTTPFDLGRVAGRPRLTNFVPTTIAQFTGREFECVAPHTRMIDKWSPGLRCLTAQTKTEDRNSLFILQTNGVAGRVGVKRFQAAPSIWWDVTCRVLASLRDRHLGLPMMGSGGCGGPISRRVERAQFGIHAQSGSNQIRQRCGRVCRRFGTDRRPVLREHPVDRSGPRRNRACDQLAVLSA